MTYCPNCGTPRQNKKKLCNICGFIFDKDVSVVEFRRAWINKITKSKVSMATALISVSEQVVEELKCGKFKGLLIHGVDGLITLMKNEDNDIILGLGKKDTFWGKIRLKTENLNKKKRWEDYCPLGPEFFYKF